MTTVPDFTTIDWRDSSSDAAMREGKAWLTPEGIPVNPVYCPLISKAFLHTYPGVAHRQCGM